MDPGQALRNDGLNPPRPPTLGGRLRESGIQAAETVIAGAAAGAAAATRSVTENQTTLALRGGGDWLDRTLRIPRRPPGLAPPPDEVPAPQIIGRPSEVEPLLERAGQRAAEVERQAAQDIESFASQQLAEAEASEGFATVAEAAAGAAEAAAAAEAGGGALALLGEGALATAGAVGAATGRLGGGGSRCCSRRHGVGHRRRAQCGFASDGLGRCNRRRHGQRRLAAEHDHGRADPERDARKRSRRSLLHPGAAEGPAAGGLQESESEPRNRPLPQIRSRPARRPRPQAQTPFGLNNVPIPVSSGSERSRVSRQSRGDRGPLGTQPSFEALRQASEPEAA